MHPSTEDYPQELVNPIALVTRNTLQRGIHSHFPNVKPETWSELRFFVHLKDYGSTTYVIIDEDLEMTLEIDLSFLENPKFNLIEWYVIHVNTEGKFYEKYVRYHRFGYQPMSKADTGPSEYLCCIIASKNLRIEDTTELEESSIMKQMLTVLERCSPYPGDGAFSRPIDPTYRLGTSRFILNLIDMLEQKLVCIYDRVQEIETYLWWTLARWNQFSLGKWYAERCTASQKHEVPWDVAHQWMCSRQWSDTVLSNNDEDLDPDWNSELSEDSDSGDSDGSDTENGTASVITSYRVQVDCAKYVNIQRNAERVKGAAERLLPKPIVIQIQVNGSPLRALVDPGSLGDFISSTTIDQLKLKRTTLDKPLVLQLAVQGSCSKINCVIDVKYSYQNIMDSRRFDVANLNDYDLILGTPWLYQHQVCIGLNPAGIVIGSNKPLPIIASMDTKPLLGSVSLTPNTTVIAAQEELMAYAEPLCRKVGKTELPPLRAINHTIPLIDEGKIYSWRPSRCPEVIRSQWNEKRDAYLKSGRWRMTTARNTVPMLLIPKPHKPKHTPELRTVFDLRECNKNTVRMTSPLPDIDGVLRCVASKPFRSVLDLTAAYEQIRIVPEHVDRTAVTTPDGNMVSLVIQIGDCNAPSTHQSLMNHIFSSYLGRFLEVYLDDIIIYSDTLQEHVQHCKLAMDILQKEKLYLSKTKIKFLPKELALLGRIVDDSGIQMDPEKVDSVLTWKTPMNRDLLCGFIGSLGYLADDIPSVRLPLGVLSVVTGDKVPFRWTPTEQRAFDEAKSLIQTARDRSRRPLTYGKDEPQVSVVATRLFQMGLGEPREPM